jgi:hypothetical protein
MDIRCSVVTPCGHAASRPTVPILCRTGTSADTDLLVTEAIACTSGMLLCLDREQRLTFVLGAIFEVSDTVAAEVLGITPDNFPQRLARARRDLRNFMNDKYGLVNQANRCRCAKKTRGFIQAGYVDPENLLFVPRTCGKSHRRCTRRSTRWAENARKSSADTRSMRRRTSVKCCGSWSIAPIQN